MTTFVDVPHGRLHVVDEGDGPAVVLLHAGIADLRSWDPMVPSLLATGLRAIRYSARGHGRSTTEDVEFSHVDDLLAVMDACGVERAVLVGNSRGGHVAVDAALAHPHRVRGVVAVAAGISGFEPPLTAEEDAILAEMDRLEEADPVDANALADLDVRLWVDGPGQREDRVDPAIREYVRMVDLALNAPGHVRGRPRRPEVDAAPHLGRLTMPVVAVAGGLDLSYVIPTARLVAERAPLGSAVIWPDVAHMIGLEAPDRLASLVVDLVGRWVDSPT